MIVFNDELVVVGGRDGPDSYFSGSDEVYGDVWASGDGISWSLKNAAAFPPRYQAMVYTMGGTLFVAGGGDDTDNNATVHDDIWYSTDLQSWQLATVSLPLRLMMAGAAVLGDTAYLVNGYSSSVGILGGGGAVRLYSASDGLHFSELDVAIPNVYRPGNPRFLNYPHTMPAVAVYKGWLYIIGGIGGAGSLSDTGFRWRPGKNEWEDLAPDIIQRAPVLLSRTYSGTYIPPYTVEPTIHPQATLTVFSEQAGRVIGRVAHFRGGRGLVYQTDNANISVYGQRGGTAEGVDQNGDDNQNGNIHLLSTLAAGQEYTVNIDMTDDYGVSSNVTLYVTVVPYTLSAEAIQYFYTLAVTVNRVVAELTLSNVLGEAQFELLSGNIWYDIDEDGVISYKGYHDGTYRPAAVIRAFDLRGALSAVTVSVTVHLISDALSKQLIMAGGIESDYVHACIE